MHYAAYKNNKELLSYLISKNADPSIKNSVKINIKERASSNGCLRRSRYSLNNKTNKYG